MRCNTFVSQHGERFQIPPFISLVNPSRLLYERRLCSVECDEIDRIEGWRFIPFLNKTVPSVAWNYLSTSWRNGNTCYPGKLYCENELIIVIEVTLKVLMAHSNKNITRRFNRSYMSNKLLSRLFNGDVKWTIVSTYKLSWSLLPTACKLASQLHLITITVHVYWSLCYRKMSPQLYDQTQYCYDNHI
jgi:hypothetical protein